MKTERNLPDYQIEFITEVLNDIQEYEYLGINCSQLFSFSKKEKKKLERIQQFFSKITLYQDFQTIHLQALSKAEIMDLGNQFLIRLFPSFQQEILSLDSLIVWESDNFLEAGCSYFLQKDSILLQNITLPLVWNQYTPSILVHEKTHALTFQQIPASELYRQGKELLPILLQKIFLQELEEKEEDSHSFLLIFDNIIRLQDFYKCSYVLETALAKRKENPNSELYQYIYYDWYIHIYDYLLAECYSLLLLEYYQQDRNRMQEKLRQTMSYRIQISDFLNYYQVNLTNPELFPVIKKNFEKVKRISFIP